jgi:hypothetical protein
MQRRAGLPESPCGGTVRTLGSMRNPRRPLGHHDAFMRHHATLMRHFCAIAAPSGCGLLPRAGLPDAHDRTNPKAAGILECSRPRRNQRRPPLPRACGPTPTTEGTRDPQKSTHDRSPSWDRRPTRPRAPAPLRLPAGAEPRSAAAGRWHRFPRSHGPIEQKVKRQWLMPGCAAAPAPNRLPSIRSRPSEAPRPKDAGRTRDPHRPLEIRDHHSERRCPGWHRRRHCPTTVLVERSPGARPPESPRKRRPGGPYSTSSVAGSIRTARFMSTCSWRRSPGRSTSCAWSSAITSALASKKVA